MYKIKKPNFKNEKNYSSIPNEIFHVRNLTVYQKYTLLFLFTHKDGFGFNIEFIQNALGYKNWITPRDHLNVLQEKNYITIDQGGIVEINLETIKTNSISTNSTTTNSVRTNPVNNTTNPVSTETTNPDSSSTNPVSIDYSSNEDKTPNLVSTNNNNNRNIEEEKQQENQKERNNNFSSKFPLGENEVKLLNEYYQNFISLSKDNNQLSFSHYEDILLLVIYIDNLNQCENDNSVKPINNVNDFGSSLNEYFKYMDDINSNLIKDRIKDIKNNPQYKKVLKTLVNAISNVK